MVAEPTSYGDEKEVAGMFDKIAQRYDLLNGIISLGIDRYWRRAAVKSVKRACSPRSILDLAAGTCDFSLELASLKPEEIVAMDISPAMLAAGREKIMKRGMESIIEVVNGSAAGIPFRDNRFDVVAVAFGVRNFSDLKGSIREMLRVLRPGGLLLVLEFSEIENRMARFFFNIWFRYIVPLVGRLISGHGDAYSFLPDSVALFPSGDQFIRSLSEAGFSDCKARRLTMGVATIYTAHKFTTQ